MSSIGIDRSGNGNNWTSNNLNQYDVMVDSPTNNFATWNPLFRGGESSSSIYASTTLSEGNLQASVPTNSYMGNTMRPQSGTWYSEFLVSTVTNEIGWGWINAPKYSSNTANAGIANKWGGYYHGYAPADLRVYDETSQLGSNIALTISNGDILQLAWDIDNNKGWIGVNNTWYAADNGTDGNPSAGTNQTFTFAGTEAANLQPYVANGTGTAVFVANFGQDSSFAGAKTPQGNSDSGGIGDFFYPVPSGFKALCSANLEVPTVIPSENFNPVLYTGNGANGHAITGVGFQPDFVWMKSRNAARSHALVDSVRGRGSILFSDSSQAQQAPAAANNDLVSFDTDGFTVGIPDRAGSTNENNDTIVSWNWKLGGSASSNSNGSVTSQVSANVDAGISIATFTLPTTVTTIGHGLSKPPELIFQKGRVSGSAWWTFVKPIGNTKALRLDTTTNAVTSTNFWNNTDPTSSVVTIGANSGGNNSWMMYCFHSVEGYSKIGSYIGNGNVDGPFVYCGFRPKMVIFKNITQADDWQIQDTVRSPFNGVNSRLKPNDTAVEDTNSTWTSVDYLSNGFKQRYSDANMNGSGKTYIFIAFAENPFKHSNAR